MGELTCPPGWSRNAGRRPPNSAGKRALVILATGKEPRYDDNPMSPPGWAVDGKGAARWTITGDPWDIVFYKLI